MASLSRHGSKTFLLLASLALAAAGCGSGGSKASPPLIAVTVVALPPGVISLGEASGAVVQVVDASSYEPISTATVTVNGIRLPYVAGSQDYEGDIAVTPGAALAISVTVGGTAYAATATQLVAYPVVTAPAAGDTWSGLRPNQVSWTPGAAPDGALYLVGVVDPTDPSGNFLWPSDGSPHALPASVTSALVPPGSLTAGDRLVVVGLVAQVPYPGAAAGSTIILSGFGVAPVTVTVGRTLATATSPAHLLVAGSTLVWSDGSDAPVKTIPVNGGTATTLVTRVGVPESVVAAGQSLYWISGNQLLRSALDGSGITVLAQGTRDPTSAGTPDVVVDATSAYWVNTSSTSICSPSCDWTIVKVPLDGGPAVTLASTRAMVTALASDAGTIYWLQQGIGPVSASGQEPTDSAVKAVPKAGGAAATVVDGFLNGPPPDPGTGYVAGNWWASGSLAVLGADLFFAETLFQRYRLRSVPVSGGPLTVLKDVSTGDETNVARGLVAAGGTLFWIDRTSVNSMPVAGGVATSLFAGGDPANPISISSLGVAAGQVVWTETEGSSVRQNGSVRSVPVGGGAVITRASSLDNPERLFVDGSGAAWVEGGAYGKIEGYGRIARVPLAGGPPITLVSALFTASPRIASDGVSLFLADRWRVKKVPLGGGALDTVFPGTNEVADLATDGVHLFVLDALGNLSSVPVAGGASQLLASGLGGPVGPVRLAGGYVYWSDLGHSIQRVPVAGGTVETVTNGLPLIADLVADGANVCFAEQATGVIRRVPVGGGTATVIGAGLPLAPVTLDLRGPNLFWIDPYHLGQVDVGSGAGQLLVTGLSTDATVANDVASDATRLYWTETGSGAIKVADWP